MSRHLCSMIKQIFRVAMSTRWVQMAIFRLFAVGNKYESLTISRRISPLITSDCRTGREFLASWESMKNEAQQCSVYLTREILSGSPLSEGADGAGHGKEDGSTRKLIVQQREELRAAVLTEALSRHQEAGGSMGKQRQAKHSIAARLAWTPWSQQCRIQWGTCTCPVHALTCMQGQSGTQSGEECGGCLWRQCNEWEPPRRTKHDTIKMAINSFFTWTRLPATCEVWRLFSHLIPGGALSKIESGRASKGMVPDFRFQLPATELGEAQVKQAELKVLNCCKTWYYPGGRQQWDTWSYWHRSSVSWPDFIKLALAPW